MNPSSNNLFDFFQTFQSSLPPLHFPSDDLPAILPEPLPTYSVESESQEGLSLALAPIPQVGGELIGQSELPTIAPQASATRGLGQSPLPENTPPHLNPSEKPIKDHQKGRECRLIQKEILRKKGSSQLLTSKNAFAEELSKSLAGTSSKLSFVSIRFHLTNLRCQFMRESGHPGCKQVWDKVFDSQKQMRKTQGPHRNLNTKTCLLIQKEILRMKDSSQLLTSKIAFARDFLKNLAGTGKKLNVGSIRNHLAGRYCKTMREMGLPGCKQVWDECRGTQKQTRKSQRRRPPPSKKPTKQKRARTGTEPLQSGASPAPTHLTPTTALPQASGATLSLDRLSSAAEIDTLQVSIPGLLPIDARVKARPTQAEPVQSGASPKPVSQTQIQSRAQTSRSPRVANAKQYEQTKTCRLIQQELRRMMGSSQQPSSKKAFARELLKNQAGTGEKLHFNTIRSHLGGRYCKTMREMGHPGCKQVWDECRDTQKQTRKSQRGRPPSLKNPTKQKRVRTGTEPLQSGASPAPTHFTPTTALPQASGATLSLDRLSAVSEIDTLQVSIPDLLPIDARVEARPTQTRRPRQPSAQASPMPMGMTTEAQKEEHVETMPSPPHHLVSIPDSHVDSGRDLSGFDTSDLPSFQGQHSKQWMEAQDPFGGYDPSSSPAPDLDVLQAEGRAHLTGSLNLDDGDDLQPDAYIRDYPFL